MSLSTCMLQEYEWFEMWLVGWGGRIEGTWKWGQALEVDRKVGATLLE